MPGNSGGGSAFPAVQTNMGPQQQRGPPSWSAPSAKENCRLTIEYRLPHPWGPTFCRTTSFRLLFEFSHPAESGKPPCAEHKHMSNSIELQRSADSAFLSRTPLAAVAVGAQPPVRAWGGRLSIFPIPRLAVWHAIVLMLFPLGLEV